MTNKSIVLVTVLFGLIVFGMFQYTILKRAELVAEPAPTPSPTETLTPPPITSEEPEPTSPSEQVTHPDSIIPEDDTPVSNEPDSPVSVFAEHEFSNGQHTVRGSLTMPNPCYELSVDTLILESYPEQVHVNITTQKTADICVQMIANIPFEAEFTASELAFVMIFVDGVLIENE